MTEEGIRYNTLLMEQDRAEFLRRPSVMLGLVPRKDGSKWSVVYGENIQEGVCGFGDTPDKAMDAFDRTWFGQD